MEQSQLERGTVIKELLEKLLPQRAALAIGRSANVQKFSFTIDGRVSPQDTWRSTASGALSDTLGCEEVKDVLDIARIILLQKVEHRIKELQDEFQNL